MISSPLRYPGGKAKLYDFAVEFLRQNDLLGSVYCEPYAGGGGLAVKLLSNGLVSHIHLNDIDCTIHAFWQAALHHNEDFCSLLMDTPITISEWRSQREIWRRADAGNILELGFATYFLNRTNRSGIIEGAGPIGGFEQKGKWKLDARLNKTRQVENLKMLARLKDKITLSNLDALDFIKRQIKRKDHFLYLDPPYFVKGSRLYKNFYLPDDHKEISKVLRENRVHNWIVSYDNVDEIKHLYKDFKQISYTLGYSAGRAARGKEVIFSSDNLELPADILSDAA